MRLQHWLYTFPLRLRSRGAAAAELDDELNNHLERNTEDYVARRMTQVEAYARLDLGGTEQTKVLRLARSSGSGFRVAKLYARNRRVSYAESPCSPYVKSGHSNGCRFF